MKQEDELFLKIIDATPLISIDLIILNSNDEILLGKRNNRPAKGYWFVPGGRIRKNETLKQALSRIAKTELGLDLNIEDAKLLGAYDHIYDDNYHGVEGINTHYVALGHQFKLNDTAQIKHDDQHGEICWMKLDELLKRNDVHENAKAYFISGYEDAKLK